MTRNSSICYPRVRVEEIRKFDDDLTERFLGSGSSSVHSYVILR
jgi:hypothetical protein